MSNVRVQVASCLFRRFCSSKLIRSVELRTEIGEEPETDRALRSRDSRYPDTELWSREYSRYYRTGELDRERRGRKTGAEGKILGTGGLKGWKKIEKSWKRSKQEKHKPKKKMIKKRRKRGHIYSFN